MATPTHTLDSILGGDTLDSIHSKEAGARPLQLLRVAKILRKIKRKA